MIYFWIFIYLFFFLFYFIIKKLPFEFYFLVLIPIQNYGLNIAFFSIKPFQIFGLLLFIIFLIKAKFNFKEIFSISKKEMVLLISFILVLLLSNIANGNYKKGIPYILVMVVSIVSVFSFLQLIKKRNDGLKNLIDCFIDVSFVSSIYFVFFLIIVKFGIRLPDSIIDTTLDASLNKGIVVLLHNSGLSFEQTQIRLCGFYGDPNSLCCSLIPSLFIIPFKFKFYTNCALKNRIFLLVKFLTIFISVFFTLSRVGWILEILAIICLFCCLVKCDIEKKQKNILLICFFSLVITVFLFFEITKNFKGISYLLNSFFSRSSFFDDFGRVSIWKSSLKNLFTKGPIFGLGYGQISSDVKRECHNTWIEFLVGGGIISFFMVLLIFTYSIYKFGKIVNTCGCKNALLIQFFVGFLSIVIYLFTISYISSPYLWLFLITIFLSDSLFCPDGKHYKCITQINI